MYVHWQLSPCHSTSHRHLQFVSSMRRSPLVHVYSTQGSDNTAGGVVAAVAIATVCCMGGSTEGVSVKPPAGIWVAWELLVIRSTLELVLELLMVVVTVVVGVVMHTLPSAAAV